MARVQETAQSTGRSVEMVLNQWIAQGAAEAEATAMLLNGPPHLYSPLGGEATAQSLQASLAAQGGHADH